MHEDFNDIASPEDTEEAEVIRAQQLLDALGTELHTRITKQVTDRAPVEQMWLEDLAQYNGEYDPDTKAELEESGQSQVYVNITRAKCNSAEARLSDMLFPTDDKSWGIEPTPVPEMAQSIGSTAPMYNEDGSPRLTEEGKPITEGDMASAIEKVARERAEAMEREIDDQLTEARYEVVCRDVIHDAVVFGTGILKGPVVMNRERKMWSEVRDEETGESIYVLEVVEDFRPGVERVDVWDYYPDMSARTPEEKEFEFERKFVTKKQLRALAKRPGYMRGQIAKVLGEDPRSYTTTSTHLSQLRRLAGITNIIDDSRYEMWEYHGPVERDTLLACGCELPDEDGNYEEGGEDTRGYGSSKYESDPFAVYDATVLFIGPHVIKANLNPLETDESPYSVFTWERDDTMVFGRGVPRTMRHQQNVINSAWRMTMDNAGLSVGPQVVVNTTMVEPADGKWELSPRKLWYLKDPAGRADQAFYTFNVPSMQAELGAIFQTAKDLVDEETSLPMIAQGEFGNQQETATARSIAMNASNIVMRRVVKHWDDEITTPTIGRFYDWNMQNSEKEYIKGDFEAEARGTSVLLVKEIQTQAMMALLDYAAHPVYGRYIKPVELLRKTIESQQLPHQTIVKTDDEIKADEEAASQGEMDIDLEKLKVTYAMHQEKLADNQMQRAADYQLRQMDVQTQLMTLAQQNQMDEKTLQAKLQQVLIESRDKRDLQGAEMILKRAMGSGI